MQPLANLASAKFYAAVGPFSSARALRRYLSKCDEVRKARKALSNGWISEESIRFFVDGLMDDFRRGEQFPHEITLAALAVALDSRKTRFVDDYLLDLARLRRFQEMDLAPGVAAIVLKERREAPRTTTTQFTFKNRFAEAVSKPVAPKLRRIGHN